MTYQTCCDLNCTACGATDDLPVPCTACEPDCPCVTKGVTPEMVLAEDILLLRDRLSREWLPETDGPPSTREVFERLTMWAKRTVEQA